VTETIDGDGDYSANDDFLNVVGPPKELLLIARETIIFDPPGSAPYLPELRT
jgi:hypothetical protein